MAGSFYLRQPAALWTALRGDEGAVLPEHPAIAVLPFADFSATGDQQYLADGIAEELITGLAKFPDLIVVARNSTGPDAPKTHWPMLLYRTPARLYREGEIFSMQVEAPELSEHLGWSWHINA